MVNANVNGMGESADEHIRVSAETKARLQRRKREDESFNEVIGRLIDKDRDLLAGFGVAAERDGESLAETVGRRKERSGRRVGKMADGRDQETS